MESKRQRLCVPPCTNGKHALCRRQIRQRGRSAANEPCGNRPHDRPGTSLESESFRWRFFNHLHPAASSDAIYAGGIFDRIGGRSVENIASLDPITGAARTWFVGGFTSQFGSVVQAIAASGTTVYLGGIFTGVGGMPRESLAAIDAATGTVTDWNPNASFAPSVTAISSLALDTDRLYFSGDFRTVGGLSRTNLAAVDLVQGAATAWNPGADTAAESVVLAAGPVYAGGAFSSIGGATRRGLVELDATSGTVSGWNPNPDSTVEALTISGNLLFVGGGFRSISGEARPRLAAFASSEPALPRIESSSVRRMPDG